MLGTWTGPPLTPPASCSLARSLTHFQDSIPEGLPVFGEGDMNPMLVYRKSLIRTDYVAQGEEEPAANPFDAICKDSKRPQGGEGVRGREGWPVGPVADRSRHRRVARGDVLHLDTRHPGQLQRGGQRAEKCLQGPEAQEVRPSFSRLGWGSRVAGQPVGPLPAWFPGQPCGFLQSRAWDGREGTLV